MEWLIGWIIFSWIAGYIAQQRGHTFWGFFVVALVFTPIISIIVALVIKQDQHFLDEQAIAAGEVERCPDCAELIRPDARLCRFCGLRFEADDEYD